LNTAGVRHAPARLGGRRGLVEAASILLVVSIASVLFLARYEDPKLIAYGDSLWYMSRAMAFTGTTGVMMLVAHPAGGQYDRMMLTLWIPVSCVLGYAAALAVRRPPHPRVSRPRSPELTEVKERSWPLGQRK
jgi:hypothetical protein